MVEPQKNNLGPKMKLTMTNAATRREKPKEKFRNTFVENLEVCSCVSGKKSGKELKTFFAYREIQKKAARTQRAMSKSATAITMPEELER